jgi:lipopolysaccharide export system protein LptA
LTFVLLLGALLSRPVTVTADHLEVLDKERKAVYRGHAQALRDSTTMTCDTLTVFYSDKREVEHIEAQGNVEAVDADRHAWGDRADFDNATGVLVVHGNPHAQQGERRVTGDEIVFTSGIDRVEVKNAHTKDDATSIDADKLVLEADRKIANWTGHVVAHKATTTVNAPLLTAHYDEKGTVTRVEARGGVEVRDKDRWAKGARADFDALQGRLVVTGKPEARQGNSRIYGKSVTFVQGSDTLEVENAQSFIDVKKGK